MSHQQALRVAVLDDYQGIAESMAPWSGLDASIDFVTEHLAGDALVARIAGCDVIVAMRERTAFPAALLERLPALRLLVTTGRRNASIDLAAAARAGVVVCGTEGTGTGTVELAWALILSTSRRIAQEDRLVRAGGWQGGVGLGLAGRTLGVVGLGKIGRRVATIGAAFGMRTIAWSPNLTPERAAEAGVGYATRSEVFAEADVVTVHMVLSERSRWLIREPELRVMKPTAVLVNTSRGPVIEESALVTALAEGWIAGAGLDVYDEEPLPADHPLRRAANATLSPHVGYVTDDNYRLFYGGAVEDIRAWLAGSPVRVLTT